MFNLSLFFRTSTLVLLFAAAISSGGCASTASVHDVVRTHSLETSRRDLVLTIDKTQHNERGEATALENGLARELARAGYRVGNQGLVVHAKVTDVRRGNDVANAMVGLGAGQDTVDVAVRVVEPNGKQVVAFSVRGAAVDKRYSDLNEVLAEDVPKRIVQQLRHTNE